MIARLRGIRLLQEATWEIFELPPTIRALMAKALVISVAFGLDPSQLRFWHRRNLRADGTDRRGQRLDGPEIGSVLMSIARNALRLAVIAAFKLSQVATVWPTYSFGPSALSMARPARLVRARWSGRPSQSHSFDTVKDGDDVDAELWEICENPHPADLTVLERSEQVARWIELTEEKLAKERTTEIASEKLAHLGPVSEQRQKDIEEREILSQPAKVKKRGQPKGGTNAASRDLGITKDDAYRANKVAKLFDEAKAGREKETHASEDKLGQLGPVSSKGGRGIEGGTRASSGWHDLYQIDKSDRGAAARAVSLTETVFDALEIAEATWMESLR